MKKIFWGMLFFLLLPFPADAADEKINPSNYICAELIASSVDGQPPIYESLQLDGYNAAQSGQEVADALSLGPVLMETFDSCSALPTEKALQHWKTARKHHPVDESSPWRPAKTTCADYAANPEDGSGFIIWLDAYNRAKTGKDASVLKDQDTLDAFLDKCNSSPKRLVLEILDESAK